MREFSPKAKVDALLADPKFKEALEKWREVEKNLPEAVIQLQNAAAPYHVGLWQVLKDETEYRLYQQRLEEHY